MKEIEGHGQVNRIRVVWTEKVWYAGRNEEVSVKCIKIRMNEMPSASNLNCQQYIHDALLSLHPTDFLLVLVLDALFLKTL